MNIDLSKKLSKKCFDAVRIITEIADHERACLYIVGGPVRDILLNVKSQDLDFVIEGDAVNFSEIVSKKLKGSLKTYKAFKTATILSKGLRIDFVTARKESYRKPASYPDVKNGTIKDDLFRRDFTINAMAVGVNKKNMGKLVDFHNGLNDLKKGLIRIMHARSFIDDPTRIFRAVRFSVRFGFEIEPDTKKLMKEAVLGGLLGEVNPGRIRKEIELFLKERDPRACLKMFSDLM